MLVTFVGHDASRSGAPVALSDLVHSLTVVDAGCEGHRVELRVVLLKGGPLEASYRSAAPTTILHGSRVGRWVETTAAALKSAGVPAGRTSSLVGAYQKVRAGQVRESDVVVANTLASLPTAVVLAAPDARVVAHVHELDHVADRVIADPSLRRTAITRVDHFIAAGPAVSRMLVDRLGLDPRRVTVVEPFVDSDVEAAHRVGARDEQRSWSLVASIGGPNRRKGPEYFVDLVAALRSDPSGSHDVRGVWVGSQAQQVTAAELRHDVDRLGLGGAVQVLESVPDAGAVMAGADVVVSTAREDPFPLALLEAAALGKPVVAFDSGGFGDVLRAVGAQDDLVPVGDVLGMARSVRRLLDDPDEAAGRGAALRAHVRAHHSADQVVPRMWAAITGAAR